MARESPPRTLAPGPWPGCALTAWVLLRQGYYKDEPEYLSGKKPKGAVKIRTAQAQKIGDELSTTFLIATKDRNMKVRCDSHAGTAEWISMINTTAREARARDARVF